MATIIVAIILFILSGIWTMKIARGGISTLSAGKNLDKGKIKTKFIMSLILLIGSISYIHWQIRLQSPQLEWLVISAGGVFIFIVMGPLAKFTAKFIKESK